MKNLAPISIEKVTNTYQGKQGCACGCGGSYARVGRAVTMRLNRINRAIANGEEVTFDDFGDENCFEYVAPNGAVTRVYTAN